MGLFSGLFGGKESDAPYPSWVTNQDKMKKFAVKLKKMADRKHIPERFVDGVMLHEFTQNKLLFIAGIMEQQGASFEKQTIAVMDHIERYWSNTDDKKMWSN